MIFLAIALLSATPAENWQVFAEGDNDVVFWIDRDSIRDAGTYKQARTKSDYHRVTWGDVDHRIALEDYDCAKLALRTRGTIAFGRDGKVLRTMTLAEDESEWKVVQPDSIAAAKIDAVCGATP
jgi:hypothetical protein